VGDIVMIQDSNIVRGQWKLAQVCEANPGKDGKVRDVQIRYKALETNTTYHGCDDTIIRRSVHRLVNEKRYQCEYFRNHKIFTLHSPRN
jgi:hypothetical protein